MKKILEKILTNKKLITNPYSGKIINCKKIDLIIENFFPNNNISAPKKIKR